MFSLFSTYLAARGEINPRDTSAVRSNDINANQNELRALPLVHSHDSGKTTCPVSLRNLKNIQTAEDHLVSQKSKYASQRDMLTNDIDQLGDKIKSTTILIKSPALSPEVRKLNESIDIITQQYDKKLAELQNNRQDVLNKYRHLKQHPAHLIVDNLNKDIHSLEHKLNNLLKNKDAQSQTFANNVNAQRQHLDAMSFDYNQQLKEIDNKIKNLRRPAASTKRDISALNPQLQKFSQQRDALQKQYQTDVISIKNQHGTRLNDYLNSFKNMANRYSVLNNNININKNKEKNILSHLDVIRRGGNNDDLVMWANRRSEAETEVKNCTEKVNLLKSKADQELKKLNEVNHAHLDNYKKQIRIEKDNLNKIIAEQINELNYNSKNTMVQVEFANKCNRPVLMNDGTTMEEVTWVPVVTQRPVEVPVITPQQTYHYRIHNELAKPYTAHAVKLTPIPDLPTNIMHSTTVPRIRVEEHEVVEMREKVMEVPSERTRTKEVVTERVIPGRVVTQTVHINDIVDPHQMAVNINIPMNGKGTTASTRH